MLTKRRSIAALGIAALLTGVLVASTGPTAGSRAGNGTPGVAGTWSGKLKSKRFPLDAAVQKPQTNEVTLTLVQNGGSLGAGTTFSIQRLSGAETFACSGSTGNGNLRLTGTSTNQSIILSAHVNGNATTMKGVATIYSANAVEDLTFGLKKE